MKLALSNGYCCGRFTCKNVNTKVCRASSKNKDDFVECDHYEGKMLKKKK